ncbi:ras guanine nucleotide exchange factor domain-containing protein, partial [Blyttiomyces helicus]
AINAGLSMAPVHRMKKTWEFPKISESYEEVAALVSPKGQYANYRKVLKDLKPPAIPFLGVYLTDLTFIELGNPDFLPDVHAINFEKRRKVHGVIKEIQSFQRTPYALMPLQGLRDF